MKVLTFLAILAPVLLGCSSTPSEPEVPTGIAVTALNRGRLTGARAWYGVHAPVRVTLDVILGIDRWADFRPGIAESRSIAASQEGGQAYVRITGQNTGDIDATCTYSIAEDDGVYRVEYQMAASSFSLWALQGAFVLSPAKNGEWTVIDQEVLVSSLSSNSEATLAAARADAEAVKKRVEEVAGTR